MHDNVLLQKTYRVQLFSTDVDTADVSRILTMMDSNLQKYTKWISEYIVSLTLM